MVVFKLHTLITLKSSIVAAGASGYYNYSIHLLRVRLRPGSASYTQSLSQTPRQRSTQHLVYCRAIQSLRFPVFSPSQSTQQRKIQTRPPAVGVYTRAKTIACRLSLLACFHASFMLACWLSIPCLPTSTSRASLPRVYVAVVCCSTPFPMTIFLYPPQAQQFSGDDNDDGPYPSSPNIFLSAPNLFFLVVDDAPARLPATDPSTLW